jgi:hypothetical protein
MGSSLELNDTLQITTEQGFPAHVLQLERHVQSPIPPAEVADRVFEFSGKPNPRFFQTDPVRVYLVHNIGGKWLFWGRIYVQSQTIAKRLEPDGSWKEGSWSTSGSFKIVDLYEPDYQRLFTLREAPPGRSYF